MLVVNDGKAIIHGTKVDLMAEFTYLLHSLIKKEIFDADDIELCVKTAKLDEKQLNKEVIEKLNEVMNDCDDVDFITDLFNKLL